MKTIRWIAHLSVAILSVLFRRLTGRKAQASWSIKTELIQRAVQATTRASLGNGIPWFRQIITRSAPAPFFRRVVRFEEDVVGGVPGLWSLPRVQEVSRTILYFHGGAYVCGSARGSRDICSKLAVGASARVFCPDYRLAPEHLFPAAQDDALSAARGIQDRTPPGELLLVGDSAGAGLVMGTLMSLRDGGGERPAAGALLCPWVAPTDGGASMTSHEATDILTAEWLDWCAKMAIPTPLLRDPRLHPVCGDLSNLPPLHVQIGGAELLHDQAQQLAEGLRRAGNEVDLLVEPEMFHVWQTLSDFEPAERALEGLCRFLRSSTGRIEPRIDTTDPAGPP